ncbi:hypothetical protein K438DRAFT_1962255 [Mycena galopus ATCC 62051]|nr:hypothetical protein K438DRAFT_1962255 [Mycena galopus ATCC 62051]
MRVSDASPDIDDREEDVRLIRRQRAVVLSEYTTDELQPGLIDLLLTSGPNGAVLVWEDQSYKLLGDDLDFGRLDEWEDVPLYKGYFALALKSVWDARGVDAPNDAEPASKWILDTVIGADDTCSQCAAPGGLALLTEASGPPFLLRQDLLGVLNGFYYVIPSAFLAPVAYAQPPPLSAFSGIFPP